VHGLPALGFFGNQLDLRLLCIGGGKDGRAHGQICCGQAEDTSSVKTAGAWCSAYVFISKKWFPVEPLDVSGDKKTTLTWQCVNPTTRGREEFTNRTPTGKNKSKENKKYFSHQCAAGVLQADSGANTARNSGGFSGGRR
jgi:hypothetical protein